MMKQTNQSNRVAVLSKLTAVSSRPVNPGTVHAFTGLDHAMALHSVHVIFYYKEKLFSCFDLDPFRVCLSEVLSLYPPVTGRISRREADGEWEVKCNDAGVRVVKATVATTVDEWLVSADGEEEKLLTAWDDMPHDDPSLWSPYSIQINEFEGGGVAIGVSCSHMQADPTCATLLIKSWAETRRREAVVHSPSFNNLSDPPLTRGLNIHNTKSLCAYYEAKSMASQTSLVVNKMGTATFKFSDEAIKQSLLEIHQTSPVATPFDLLAALFWARIARLKHPKSESKHSLSICVDFRNKLKLSYGHYGNALHFSLLSLPDVRDKEDLGDIAGAVHRHVSSQEDGEFWSALDGFESRKGEGGEAGAPFRMYGPELTCVSMEHMVDFPGNTGNKNEPLMYTAVFGNRKRPVHVSYHIGNVEGEGLIMVMPSPDGGLGRMVTVTLPEEELELLREDEVILNLNPTMVQSLPRCQGENLEKNKILYGKVQYLAEKHGCTPARLALAWIVHQGDHVVPIPGTTKTENIDANVGSLRVKLTKEDIQEISAMMPANAATGNRVSDSLIRCSWKFANTPPKASNATKRNLYL